MDVELVITMYMVGRGLSWSGRGYRYRLPTTCYVSGSSYLYLGEILTSFDIPPPLTLSMFAPFPVPIHSY